MIRTIYLSLFFLALATFVMTPALAQEEKPHSHSHGHSHASTDLPTLGVAVIVPTKGNKTRGSLRLMQKGENLVVTGKIRQLTPGEHGFHIHEFGDLRDMAEGKSAGGHFNPKGVQHGGPGKGHVGDLGNVTADAEGVASVDITLEHTALHFVLGRCFVVHAGKDDLTSQPSGDAGPRVGLGLIGIGNAEFKATGNDK